MQKNLKILYVSSEMSPLISTGGLADVANALPRALHAQGHDIRIAMPCYRSIPAHHQGDQYCLTLAEFADETQHGALRISNVPGTDIPLYLIEHDGYFGRTQPYGEGAYEYDDNARRFSFFCLALLHAIPQTGWIPDVIHCNDWHTAPIPAFLETRYRKHPVWGGKPTLFTIHNLAFQGRYDAQRFSQTGLEPELLTPDVAEHFGDFNLMKTAIHFATRLSTVSPRYAKEIQTLEYGAGLDGALRLRSADLHGILNGVDYETWNPAIDPHLAAPYSVDDLSGKALCKADLQKCFGFSKRDVPIFGMVTRLFWQKGIDLLIEAMTLLADADFQVIVLGSGDPAIEKELLEASAVFPEKLQTALQFDAALAHRIQGGSDFFLMPSRYEPCGLSQLYALAYGAVPVVRRTGGLADSVCNDNPVYRRKGQATGIVFVPQTPQALARAMRRALALYRHPGELAAMGRAGMQADFSWDRSSQDYIKLYQEAIESK